MDIHRHLHRYGAIFDLIRSVRACSALAAIMVAIFIFAQPAGAAASDGPVQDIFIGMVRTDGAELILERCDLGKTRYKLVPAEGAGDPLARLRDRQGMVQAEIIASYRADGEAHILDVTAVDRMVYGKTCHLLDAVDALFTGDANPAANAGQNAESERWEALAAGAAAPADTETIGAGEHAYRFILMDPRTAKPSPNTDFAFSTNRNSNYDLPFVSDEKKVFQGRTDASGQTPVFRLPVRLPDSAFDLRERFGSGSYGDKFQLIDVIGNGLSNTPYLLAICSTPPREFRRYTYPDGTTAYTASEGPADVRVKVLDDIDQPTPTDCDKKAGQGEYPPPLPAHNEAGVE